MSLLRLFLCSASRSWCFLCSSLLCLFLTSQIQYTHASLTSAAIFHRDRVGIGGTGTAIQDDNSGTIYTIGGFLYIDMEFGSVDWSALPANCSENGLRFHIHTEWTYGDESPETADRMGVDACHSNYTGGHFDPWFACSAKSSEKACVVNGGCIPSSSIYSLAPNSSYTCDAESYETVAYTCEMGDWAGKYGVLDWFANESATGVADSILHTGDLGTVPLGSYWETRRDILSPEVNNAAALYSMVLHCNRAPYEPVFCAPVLTAQNPEVYTGLTGNQVIDVDFSDAGADYAGMQVSFSAGGIDVTVPDTAAAHCAGGWRMFLYDGWDFAGVSQFARVDCDVSAFAGVYDPTHTCIANSASRYCTDEQRCGDAELFPDSYRENTTYSCADADKYFGCAVGDIAGRVGPMASNANGVSYTDALSPPLFTLGGKALVMVCISGNINNLCAITIQTNGTVVSLGPASMPSTFSPTPPTAQPTTDSAVTLSAGWFPVIIMAGYALSGL